MSTQDTSYWDLISNAYDRVSICNGPHRWLDGLQRFPRGVGLLLAVHWLQSEVNNGGLIQFFDNATGVVAPEAIEGLQAIGLEEAAAVVQSALDLLPTPYPRDGSERERHRQRLLGATEGLDDRLYELWGPRGDKLYDAMDRYAAGLPRAGS